MSCNYPNDEVLADQCICHYDWALSSEPLELGSAFLDYSNGDVNIDRIWKSDKPLGTWMGDCCSFEERDPGQAIDASTYETLLV